MKQLSIDFAPNSWRRALRGLSPFCWLSGLAGLALCVSAAHGIWYETRQHQQLDRELHRLRMLRDARATPPALPRKEPIGALQANAVNDAIEQLNLPWRDVLDAIEAATPSSIALITLEPDAKKHQIRGQAEARSSDAMIAYIEQLKHQSLFDAVDLTRHEVNLQDPNKPIRFQFDAHWMENSR
jgi:Tfp pilus assembly protein PilN